MRLIGCEKGTGRTFDPSGRFILGCRPNHTFVLRIEEAAVRDAIRKLVPHWIMDWSLIVKGAVAS